jgi:hypothetical protein
MATSSSFVSVDQVIATAKSINEKADTIDRAYFKEWVYLGLNELGPNTSWYNEATIYPTEMSLRKPLNMHSAIDLALYDSTDTELRYVLRGKGSRIHSSDNALLNSNTYAPTLGSPVDVSEDAYYFNLGSNGDQVSYAFLKYWQFPEDENGDLLIPETDVLPLSIFLKYMWYMRKDDKVGMGQFHNLWIAARNEARTAHKLPSMLEGTEIARGWNSMIKKYRFKTF